MANKKPVLSGRKAEKKGNAFQPLHGRFLQDCCLFRRVGPVLDLAADLDRNLVRIGVVVPEKEAVAWPCWTSRIASGEKLFGEPDEVTPILSPFDQ